MGSSSLRTVALAATLLLSSGLALAQPSLPYAASGIEFLSQIPPGGFGSPAATAGSSNWGYTSPGGREYVIQGLNNKTAFVDITNPTAPVIAGLITHPTSPWNEMKTKGTYCYNVNESGGGMQVIDLANIDATSGTRVSLVRSITSNGLTTAHTVTVNPDSNYVYLNGSNVTGSGGTLVAFSLADPANPVLAGVWQGGPYVHDSQVVTYTSGPQAGREIAYACCGGAGLYVVDVTDKSNMTVLASRTYAGLQYCHQAWLSEDRQFLYVNDELDGPAQGVPSGLTRVFNVADPANPILVSSFTSAVPGAIDHNIYIRGNLQFQSNYTSGLRVFDMSTNAQSPTEIAWIDTHPETDAATFNGVWNNYPYFPSGTIAIADINRGMIVVRVNLDQLTIAPVGPIATRVEPDAPTPVSILITNSGTPVDPATVRVLTSINGGPFVPSPMQDSGSGTFTGSLPPAPCGALVRWYYEARSQVNRTFQLPLTAPASFFEAESYSSRETILSFDMETDAGWTSGAPGDTATAGLWERGDPEPTAAQPGDDHTPAPGINCWITGRRAGGGVGSFDVDGGFTTLLSPIINLANGSPLTRIGYWRWYSNTAGGAPGQDVFAISISNNAGATWTTAETVGPGAPNNSGGWIYHEFRVLDLVPTLTSQMQLRFVADDANAGSVVEAAIDDLLIYRQTCSTPTCDYDFNQDENVDLLDAQQMAQVFVGLITPEATWLDGDLNGDENADLTDAQLLAAYVVTGNCGL